MAKGKPGKAKAKTQAQGKANGTSGSAKSQAKTPKRSQPAQTPAWESRVLQVAITCVIVVVFWNLLDFILDEYVMRQGYAFDVYYDLLLPLIVGLAVELFPKKRK